MRPSKEEYFMWLAKVASTRATCNRRSVGCVIIDKSGRILATGYNGSSPGKNHCADIGHLMHDGHCVRTTHAEANAIGHAARSGTALGGSVIYVTCHPCVECLKLLVAAGIDKVIYLEDYHVDDDLVSTELALGCVAVKQYDGGTPWLNVQ